MTKPLFITFEGPEGSGKSTQLKLLAERLRASGRAVSETREPGGTRIGMQIRKVLLDPENRELAQTAEMLLMFASRAQNIEEFIRPALAHGHIVLCDRFTDSTVAYQGYGRGIDRKVIASLTNIATGSFLPEMTLLLDIETELGLTRARTRNQQVGSDESRFDDEALVFHRKVRAGFQDLASENPQRIRVVDASGTQDQVADAVWRAIAPLLES